MTSSSPRRFPVGLTLAAAVVVAACVALGVWQAQRFQWKLGVLAQIAAMEKAPVQPIAPVLARAARGQDVEFTRVAADCAAGPPEPARFVMGVRDSQYIWRAQSTCRLGAPPYDGLIADRGIFQAASGATAAPNVSLPQPGRLVGVLRRGKTAPGAIGLAHPVPLVLVVEQETPAAPGVAPAPPPAGDAPDSLQYVGAYAPTWFGLAAVAACFYAAMLWRRYRP
jgi:surfeit locus 1 family protein